MKARPERGRFWGEERSLARPTHFGAHTSGSRSPRGMRVLAMGLALAALAAVGVVAGAALAGHGKISSILPGSGTPPPPPKPLTPTRVLSMPPGTIANGTDTLAVTLSAPAKVSSPEPTLYPAVAGTWTRSGNTELFTPASTLEPCSSYRLTVWANTIAEGHSRVGRKHIRTLNVACPPIAGLQQALARLGYLGARLHPKYAVSLPHGRESRREAAEHAYKPFHGRLAPDPEDAPPVEMGTLDETTKGGLEVFQADHDLEATGEPNAATWQKLLIVSSLYHRNPDPYTWVSVTESIPETLEVHKGDHVALTSPANTGVAGAETAQGIFPIFARFTSTTMTGTNPDGSKYKDPGVPWVNYFNGGDAVHGFPRGSYGSPQSNGCVELPISTAAEVYPMLAIGDIVWVT